MNRLFDSEFPDWESAEAIDRSPVRIPVLFPEAPGEFDMLILLETLFAPTEPLLLAAANGKTARRTAAEWHAYFRRGGGEYRELQLPPRMRLLTFRQLRIRPPRTLAMVGVGHGRCQCWLPGQVRFQQWADLPGLRDAVTGRMPCLLYLSRPGSEDDTFFQSAP